MERSTVNGVRRVVRIHVEPVEVELDDDGAILITALQSALPGASGLYFKDIDDCKSSVRFDGKKLQPPSDGWKDRKYFASLGCRPFDYPFGSYVNATKQFERAVNIVKSLLGSSKLIDYSLIEKEIRAKRRNVLSPRNVKSENMQQLLTTLTQNQTLPEMSDETPLEQQFVDLARLSTAKDSIIEQQRTDIKNCTETIGGKEKAIKQLEERNEELEKRCRLQEDEITTLRSLSREQSYMSEKVNELLQKLAQRDNELAAQKTEIDFLVKKIAKVDCGRETALKIPDSGTSLEITQSTIEQTDSLKSKTDHETSGMSYIELSDALAYAKARIEKLENDVNVADEKYQQLRAVYIAVIAENKKMKTRYQRDSSINNAEKEPPDDLIMTDTGDTNWTNERLEDLKKELAASEKRVAELTKMVHVLTNDTSTPEPRLTGALASCYECKRCTDRNDTKIQITVTK